MGFSATGVSCAEVASGAGTEAPAGSAPKAPAEAGAKPSGGQGSPPETRGSPRRSGVSLSSPDDLFPAAAEPAAPPAASAVAAAAAGAEAEGDASVEESPAVVASADGLESVVACGAGAAAGVAGRVAAFALAGARPSGGQGSPPATRGRPRRNGTSPAAAGSADEPAAESTDSAAAGASAVSSCAATPDAAAAPAAAPTPAVAAAAEAADDETESAAAESRPALTAGLDAAFTPAGASPSGGHGSPPATRGRPRRSGTSLVTSASAPVPLEPDSSAPSGSPAASAAWLA